MIVNEAQLHTLPGLRTSHRTSASVPLSPTGRHTCTPVATGSALTFKLRVIRLSGRGPALRLTPEPGGRVRVPACRARSGSPRPIVLAHPGQSGVGAVRESHRTDTAPVKHRCRRKRSSEALRGEKQKPKRGRRTARTAGAVSLYDRARSGSRDACALCGSAGAAARAAQTVVYLPAAFRYDLVAHAPKVGPRLPRLPFSTRRAALYLPPPICPLPLSPTEIPSHPRGRGRRLANAGSPATPTRAARHQGWREAWVRTLRRRASA